MAASQMGPNNAAAYMVSSKPFLSSSIDVPASGSTAYKAYFAGMTRWITIKNDVASNDTESVVRIGFSEIGVLDPEQKNYYFTLKNGESFTGDWRVTEVWYMGDGTNTGSISIIAGMTGVDTNRAVRQTSNWTASLGIGY